MKIRIKGIMLAALALTAPSLIAQNTFTGAVNTDWATSANWSTSAVPTTANNAYIVNGKNAVISTPGEGVSVLFIGDALNSATSSDGSLSMTGGTLDVKSLRIGTDSDGAGNAADSTVNGSFAFTDGTINALNGAANLQRVQIGSTAVPAPGLASITALMTMGDGTTDPTLTFGYNAAGGENNARFEVGTGAGVDATFNFNSGTITGVQDAGARNVNLIIGQAAVNSAVMTIGDAAGTTAATFTTPDDVNFNNGNSALTIGDQGTLNVNSVNLNNQVGGTTTLTINPGGTLNANLDFSGRPGQSTVVVDSGGVLDIGRDLNGSTNAGNGTLDITVNTGGTINVGQDLVGTRPGYDTLNIDGGTVNFELSNGGLVDRLREFDSVNLGTGGTGSRIGLHIGSRPLANISDTTATIGAGTHTIDILGVLDTQNANTTNADVYNVNLSDIWIGGDGVWTDLNDLAWSKGIDPSGIVEVGQAVNAVGSTVGPFTVDGSATFDHTGVDAANWSAKITLDTAIQLERLNSDLVIGPLRARIETNNVVTRPTDLNIARVYDTTTGGTAGRLSDAQWLTLTAGTLQATGSDLIIGEYARPPVGPGAPAQLGAIGNVQQLGPGGDPGDSAVTVDNLVFGGQPVGATSNTLPGYVYGGQYDLDNGTLTVLNSIVEGEVGAPDSRVDNAQFYIDGGTLDFQGTDIVVQSFRVGDSPDRTGTHTLPAGQTIQNTGTLYAGRDGGGTLIVDGDILVRNTTAAGDTGGFGTVVVSEGGGGITNTQPDPFGFLELTAGSSLTCNAFQMATQTKNQNTNAKKGDGTLIATDATINTGNPIIAFGGIGFAELNGTTTWNAQNKNNLAGGVTFNVAQGRTFGANDNTGSGRGGDGLLILNDSASIVKLGGGGNFETASFNQGNRLTLEAARGEVEMNGNSSIVFNGTGGNFIIGQQENTRALVTINGSAMIDIDNSTIVATQGDININAGQGTLIMNGGTIAARDLNLSNNNNAGLTPGVGDDPASSSTIEFRAGTVTLSAGNPANAGVNGANGQINYRNNGGQDSVSVGNLDSTLGTMSLTAEASLFLNRTTVDPSIVNEFTVIGSGHTIDFGARLAANANSRMEWVADTGGVSPIIVGSAATTTEEPRLFGAELVLDMSLFAAPPSEITLIDNREANPVGGIFSGLPQDAAAVMIGGTQYFISYVGGDGNDVTLVSAISDDNDMDGMSNDYETANGLNPNDPSDRDTDLDGDGISNYDESQFNTAANDASSFPQLVITSYDLGTTTSTLRIRPVTEGIAYDFAGNNDLNFPATFLGTETADATDASNGYVEFVDTMAADVVRFYQVEVSNNPAQPPPGTGAP